jgi:hypothetical protein
MPRGHEVHYDEPADLSGVLAEWCRQDISFAEGLRRLDAKRDQFSPRVLRAAITEAVRFIDRNPQHYPRSRAA